MPEALQQAHACWWCRRRRARGACPQLLWQEGGIKRFYRGFTPCLVRAAPANGVMLLTVEKVQALLGA